MNLTILGSDTIAGDTECSAYLIKIQREYLLLDCGPGTYIQLIKSRIDLDLLKYIFITHTHVDHLNDLFALLWRFMFGINRKTPLRIFGPREFKKFFNFSIKLYPQIAKVKFQLNISELHNQNINLGKIKVITREVLHTKFSNAYRTEHNNKSIVYSGDTDYCDNIINLSKNADILIIECSMPDKKKVDGHLTPSLCGKIAKLSNVKKLILDHRYPECKSAETISAIKKYFKGDLLIYN
ncbi:MAG: ribonuclease Z [Nanoarchaeota archaeon]